MKKYIFILAELYICIGEKILYGRALIGKCAAVTHKVYSFSI